MFLNIKLRKLNIKIKNSLNLFCDKSKNKTIYNGDIHNINNTNK